MNDKFITKSDIDDIRKCEQCGTCTASCQLSDVSGFNIRKFLHHLQLELYENQDFLHTAPWFCTLCQRCHELCTEGLEIPRLVFAIRRLALRNGVAPSCVKNVHENILNFNSPYISRTRTKRSWSQGLIQSSSSDTLYWVGCTSSVMAPSIARSVTEVLMNSGSNFRVLENEPCCGEPLLALGLIAEAQSIATKVFETIQHANVKKLVTSCSGCYHTFTRLYPQMLNISFSGIEILHISQLWSENPSPEFKLKRALRVTYHDPCSLGRKSKIYDAPRTVLNSIGELKLIEMPRTKDFSACCGAGGGLWSTNHEMAMEIAYKMLMRDVMPLNVDALVSCCPLCNLNFKYTVAKKKLPLKAYDLAEIVATALMQGMIKPAPFYHQPRA